MAILMSLSVLLSALTAAPSGGDVVLRPQSCVAENKAAKGSFGSACDGTYPAQCPAQGGNDRVSCNDGGGTSNQYSEQQDAINGKYGGIKLTYYNTNVADCSKINTVKVCYEWTASSANAADCDISVDNDGGSSWVAVTTTCPAKGYAENTVTCVDVTSLEDWKCSDFFGSSGVRAQIKSEYKDSATAVMGVRWDALYYEVNYANATSPPDTIPPAQVTGLAASAMTNAKIKLNWNANTEPDLNHYNVYRSLMSGGPYARVAQPTTNSYVDGSLQQNTMYYYIVSAVDNSNNEGLSSNEASAKTLDFGPGSYLKSYVSEVDGSSQIYGVYIPSSYDHSLPTPVSFNAHGFGGRASSSFDSTRTSFANTNRWILVNLDGRGNTFYDGIGENDMLKVIQELKNSYSVDENRLYLEGCSMGGTAAYRQGIRHPDVLAALGGTDGWTNYTLWHKHWYAPASNPNAVASARIPNLMISSPAFHAINAKDLGVYIRVDTRDTTVEPDEGRSLRDRLNELGYPNSYSEKRGIHCANYDPIGIYNFFLGKSLNPNAKYVVYKTNTLRFNRNRWVQIDRLKEVNNWAVIKANVSENMVNVEADNLTRYTIFLNSNLVDPAGNVTVYTNGILSYSGPVDTITVYAILDQNGGIVGWTTEPQPEASLVKRNGLSGPIGDAYVKKFIVVYGTSGSSAETTENANDADRFVGWWNQWMLSSITKVADSTVTPQDIQNSNLILFGTRDSNSIIAQIDSQLPIHMTNNSVVTSTATYSGDNYGLYMVYPNPLTNSTYAVISHGVIQNSQAKDLEALPWYWPDYVIFDKNMPTQKTTGNEVYYLPDAWVEAGWFDLSWQKQ